MPLAFRIALHERTFVSYAGPSHMARRSLALERLP